ncbi:MAG: hypothetical protein QFX36_04080 [Archaeoglobales archaeon]|nr:hypothetical protein [Archaeoglobales archaeon]
MDKRAYSIRNSIFLDIMIKDAVYAIDSTANIIKVLHQDQTVEASRQLLIGLLNEFRRAKEFSKLLDGLNINNIYLTDVDKLLRVGNKVVAIFEFKHPSDKEGELKIYIKRHTNETLQAIAKALNCRVILISYYNKKWLIKDITDLKITYDYKAYKIGDFGEFDDKELLDYIRRLIGGRNEDKS